MNHARGDGANESRKSGVAWSLTSRYFEIEMSHICHRMRSFCLGVFVFAVREGHVAVIGNAEDLFLDTCATAELVKVMLATHVPGCTDAQGLSEIT